ncbi:MAG: TIR domain-containing protein, partial [Blastocatellia bacterium]
MDLDLSPDTRVSRVHAKVFYQLSTWWVEDLNSKYGTFLNGQRVTEATPLTPGDELQMGNTVIQVDFFSTEVNSDPGLLEDQFTVSETQPPDAITEDKRVEILARVSDIAARFKSQEAMLEAFLDVVGEAFPESDRRTILLIEDRELVVRASWPRNQAFAGFTLARQVIKSQQAVHWVGEVPSPDGRQVAPSLQDISEAICAPMISNGSVVGVVSVEIQAGQRQFSATNLSLLSVIANIIGSAIKASRAPALPRLPSVFLSYSNKDRDFVTGLASDLRRRGVKVWFDQRIRSGQNWRKQIDLAIRDTDALIAVMSPAGVASFGVHEELDTALSSRKLIIPLIYQSCD